MKKLAITLLLGLGVLTLSACKAEDQAPVITGADDTTILQGETFNILEGVTALDTEDGDLTAQIETDGFVDSSILGEHAVNYIVTDSAGNTTRVTRIITVEFVTASPSSLYNGDFALGTGGWSLDEPGAEADFDVVDEVMEVNITSLGQEWWNLQMHQTISIDEGVTYKLSFDAKTDTAKRIGVGMEDTADGYVMLPGGDVVFELTTDFMTYEYYYTSDRTIDTAKFVLYLGRIGEDESPAKVYVDNVSVEVVELDDSDIVFDGIEPATVILGDGFDIMAGVTAEDSSGTDLTASIETDNVVITNLSNVANYVVQYRVSDGTTTKYVDRVISVVLGKENDWELFNTDFALGVTGWSLDFPVGEGTMTVEDGVLVANLTDLGDAWWHIQLFQGGISIEEGKTYRVSFDAKADGSKRIGLGIEDVADGYADLKGESVEWDLTSDWVTYTYDFSAPRTIDTTKYAIFLGMIAGTDEATTVYIDNFEVIMLEDSLPTISGATDTTISVTADYDLLDGVTASDFEDGDLTADITVSGTFDSSVAGIYTVTYSITDSFGNTTTVDREITVNAEVVEPYELFNSGFDNDLANWLMDFNAGTSGTATVVDGVLQVVMDSVGSEWWHVQLHQDGRSVSQDQSYEVTFQAKADGVKTIGFGVEDTADNYADITGQGHAIYNMTTDWQTFTFTFTSDRSIDTTKFVVFLGQMDGTDTATTVYIDNIIVTELADSLPVIDGADDTTISVQVDYDLLAGVTATDPEDGDLTASITVSGTFDSTTAGVYTVTYTVTDSYGNTTSVDRTITINAEVVEPYELFNSEFNNGLTDWLLDFNADGAGTGSVVDGVLEVDITSVGNDWWHIQLHQDARSVTAGKTYVLTFDAKADGVKTIGAGAEDTADGFADITGLGHEVFDLSTDWQTFTFTFNADRTISSTKFVVFLGKMADTDTATTVYLDNIQVTELADSHPQLNGLMDATITAGDAFDPTAGITASDYEDGDITADIVITGTVNNNTPGDYTLTYTITDSFGNVTSADRIVTVLEDTGQPISVVTNPYMEASDGWVFDFPGGQGTMAYSNNELVATLTDLSDAWWKIQLQQDGINLVEGQLYMVVLEAKSDSDRVVGLGIEDTADGFADIKGESVEWNLTADYQTFYYVFRANRTISTAKLALFLGQITGSDPTSIVTVNRFDMVSVDDYNILLNSNFADDSNWNYDFPVGTGTMSAADNKVTIALTDVGTAWWHVQLHQTDVSIISGKQYVVSFKVTSDQDRRIGLGIEDPANGFADLKYGEVVEWDVGANWQTVSYVFTAQDTVSTAKFAVFLGQITGTDPASTLEITDFVVIELT